MQRRTRGGNVFGRFLNLDFTAYHTVEMKKNKKIKAAAKPFVQLEVKEISAQHEKHQVNTKSNKNFNINTGSHANSVNISVSTCVESVTEPSFGSFLGLKMS